MLWNKIKNKIYILVALIAVFIFFHPIIFSGKTLYFRDIHTMFYPMKYFLSQSLKSASIPFWCPLYFCGAPFMSDIQTAVFYPPSLIFLIFSYPISFNIYIILHLFLSFCFVYYFIRDIALSLSAGIFTAIAYSYGGYVLSSVNVINNLTVVTWLPAMLWAYYRALTGKTSYYFLLIIFVCLAILGGEPQLFILSLLVTFSFGIVLISGKNINIKSFIKYNVIFALIVTAALLITVIQWAPTFLDYKHSIRLQGFTLKEASLSSLEWYRLKHLLIPAYFNQSFGTDPSYLVKLFPPHGSIPWLLSIYPGFLVTFFASIGIFSKPSREKAFWFILFVAGIILALGNNTPVHSITYRIFPFFRFPEKFYFLSNIGLVVLSGYGFDRFVSILKKYGVRIKYIIWLIPLILFIDLYAAHANLNITCKTGFYQFSNPAFQPLMRDKELFRVYVDEENINSHLSDKISITERQMIYQVMMVPNSGTLKNINYIDGKTGLELEYQWIITEILGKTWPEKIKLLQLANVKYIISSENIDLLPGVKDHIKKIKPLLFEIRNNLPRAWMVGKIIPLERWTLKDFGTNEFDYRTSAMGPRSTEIRHTTPYYQEADKIEYENPNTINIDINATRPGVIVLSESSYPGWHATLNGKKADIIRLNYLFQGVEIDSGRHKIRFEYRPPFFRLYMTISLLSVIVIILLWFFRNSFKFISNGKDYRGGIKR